MFKNLSLSTKRLYLQIAATIVTNSYFLAPYLKYLPCPSLNCYACPVANFACPIGSLQYFVIIGRFPFFLLGILFLFGGLIGRWSCGFLCPFGLFQDLLAKIRKAKFNMPPWLGWGRYVSLVGVAIIIPAITKDPWFSKLCPAGTLEAGIPIVGWAFFKTKALGQYSAILGMTGWLFWVKIGLLAGTIAAAVYIKRPFCRFICPLGAIFGIFNRVSLLQITVDKNKTNDKTDCRKLCPVDIDIGQDPASAKCIRCMQCTKCSGVNVK
ncbi:4Fe-4S binding protein [candidate division TA06 bacterium]|uniref:4Fe-4S binding protein n=1 Tax=candidate division TA06 bacterium TaxID=2250710 RepID=A0A933ICP3_UNCT6|nr:4Fe-4S binding protein [candidate division TA06 bacterium]